MQGGWTSHTALCCPFKPPPPNTHIHPPIHPSIHSPPPPPNTPPKPQRCLYGYFMGTGAMSEIPYISLPKNAVLELTPGPFGCTERVINLFERQDLVE
jgi:hypothetical protein